MKNYLFLPAAAAVAAAVVESLQSTRRLLGVPYKFELPQSLRSDTQVVYDVFNAPSRSLAAIFFMPVFLL
jgi:hypothetical protein